MQKIDLHQDLISSFVNNLSVFKNKVEGKPVNNTNAGGLPNYKEADLQIVWAGVWPYELAASPENPSKKILKFSNSELIKQRKQYEQLRKENNIYLVLDGKDLEDTKYVDFRLNFVYHLKGIDGIGGIQDLDKLKNAGFRSVQMVWEFDNKFAHCHRSIEGGVTDAGYEILQYLDQNKMIIDTANMNYQSMMETYQFTKKPIMNSHTNVKALFDHSRNVADDFLEMIERSDGLIGLSLTAEHMVGVNNEATLDNFINEIKYVREHVGDSHVGFGSGYHSVYFKRLVSGMENISNMTLLEEKVVKEFGYKFAGMFFWENAYRMLVHTV